MSKIRLLKDINVPDSYKHLAKADTVLEAEPTFNSQWKVTIGIDASFNVDWIDAEEVEDEEDDSRHR